MNGTNYNLLLARGFLYSPRCAGSLTALALRNVVVLGSIFECWKKEVDGVVEDELGEVS